jgi:hypothetical protein
MNDFASEMLAGGRQFEGERKVVGRVEVTGIELAF